MGKILCYDLLYWDLYYGIINVGSFFNAKQAIINWEVVL